ncbi:dTDP-4-amino-4,6-dideoxygalactose transaminase [soil metagenome]
MTSPIRFSAPTFSARALQYLTASIESGHLDGDSPFTVACHQWLADHYGVRTLLTPSCTASLELAALLAEVGPGDEVIMPSYTFSSTANAFVLRGATPVFVDVRDDTLNLDETLLEAALTARTKAIAPVHYAGVGCDMDAICTFAEAHGLMVIEDAAQAHLATWRGQKLGTFGALGCISYHVSKNVVCGEGGALVVNDDALTDRAEIIWEKGTNRKQFRDEKVAKYEWLDVGSSYLPSDLQAAVLLSQFEDGAAITARRLAVWDRYHAAFAPLEAEDLLRRPAPPPEAVHNGHIYHVRLPDAETTAGFRARLREAGAPTHLHYVPLHSAPAGRRFGRAATPMPVTDAAAATLIRLPLNATISDDDVERVMAGVTQAVGGR